MMSDLISREDLINWLTSSIIMFKGTYGDLGSAVNMVREKVKVMPSAEPKQKKGHWLSRKEYRIRHRFISLSAGYWWCSKCGERSSDRSDFCPNCGADMRETNERDTD